MRNAIALCSYSGSSLEPYRRAGWTCYALDTTHAPGIHAHPERPGLYLVGADVRHVSNMAGLPRRFAVGFGFPPCTHLASSGARWWAKKGPQALAEGVGLANATREALAALVPSGRWYVENPVGRLSTAGGWGPPNFSFNPCDYAGWLPSHEQSTECYTKRTCIWAGPGFIRPQPKPLPATLGSKMHKMSSTWKRQRQLTPMGWATAVYAANH